MPHRHLPAATTHTIELQQVLEINRCLAELAPAEITAEALGMAGRPVTSPVAVTHYGSALPSHPVLRPTAALRYLSAEGSPRFPYVLGHFCAVPVGSQLAAATLVIELHSDALDKLSAQLRLRHCWGSAAVLVGKAIR
ncbi:MAG TPA: hypothetical protein VLL08_21925 [Kineosporiaceae bacterium]|nr:hypothetical protein [Kineosporiaceae bacterium]